MRDLYELEDMRRTYRIPRLNMNINDSFWVSRRFSAKMSLIGSSMMIMSVKIVKPPLTNQNVLVSRQCPVWALSHVYDIGVH